MTRYAALSLGLLGLILAAGISAAADDVPAAEPAPPEIPAPVASGEALEPEVTIIQTDRRTIHEYRVNGQLYMVKIQPRVGPAYYLIDSNGDGTLDVEQEEQPYDLSIPQWVLFRW